MSNAQVITGVDEGDGYKYLGILEADDLKHAYISKDYLRRIRKILKSKLNGGDVVSAINARAVSIIRYGEWIIKWTEDELGKLDRKTRKMLTINRALHP